MGTKFFAALFGFCTLTAAVASDRQIINTGLQDFQGRYDLVDGRLLTVTQRGQRLIMQLDNQPEAELVAVGSGAFKSKFGEQRLEFVQYPNGNVPAVRLIDSSSESQTSCQPPSPELPNHSCPVPKNVSGPNRAPPPQTN